MASVSSDIKKGLIAPVYLFYGEEAFKRRNYKELLIASVAAGNSMNYSCFEGKDTDFAAVYDAVVTMPFFADKRLVIVENTGKFQASKKKNKAEEVLPDEENSEKDQKAGEAIEKIINDLPSTTCLAFFEESAAKTKKIYKQIASKGVVVECKADTAEQVINWLAKGFAGAGKKVRKSTLTLLVDRCGTDYDNLKTEFEKILGYMGDRDVVEDSDICTMTSETVESKIFDMLDAMSNKDVGLVMDKYMDLIANKEHPLYILAMIRMQLRTILQVAEERERGRTTSEMMSLLKKQEFVIKKSDKFLKIITRDDIINMLDEIADIDKRCKSGDLTDQIGVEMLLIKFSSR